MICATRVPKENGARTSVSANECCFNTKKSLFSETRQKKKAFSRRSVRSLADTDVRAPVYLNFYG
jgi:hypothetical protein